MPYFSQNPYIFVAVFTGGTQSEGVRFWDVRAKRLVYELSTGNNRVCALAWNKQRTTLYAATEAEHRPGPGGRAVYRKARKVKRDQDAQRATEEDSEENYEDIDEDGMEFYDELRWPYSAYHKEDYFGEVYDAGSMLMCKSFSILPQPLLNPHLCSPICIQGRSRHGPHSSLWLGQFWRILVLSRPVIS